jgi:hypothetical protein
MDIAIARPSTEMRASLLAAAKSLDTGEARGALEILRALPLARSEQATRLVALALWKRVVLSSAGSDLLAGADAKSALIALDEIGAALLDDSFIWNAYRALPVLEKEIGAADAASATAAILWDRALVAHEGIFVAVFELFFRGGDAKRCHDAWHQYLSLRKDHVPGYWHFLLYARTLPAASRTDVADQVTRVVRAAGREDLEPLIGVYLLQMRQASPTAVLEIAGKLSDPVHRTRVTEYIIGLGFMPDDLPAAVATFRHLASDAEDGNAAVSFMEARLANAEGKWSEVLRLAERAVASEQYRYPAELLAANALGRLHRADEARAKLETVSRARDAAHYLHARAAFIRVTVDLVEKGLPTPDMTPAPVFEQTPGRPLAQSLWVGRRLRWIERLAISSYLDNGWRFQLYAYDDVENVPEGCEVLDASAIIPRKEVFREGFGSGLHAGSVGAFSDLFRYRLLYQRGGMWTDTDVINLRKFDPDGRRFVSTEITDAGLTTLNGAIMAAPAGDALIGRAYERACELLRSDDMFFTRIGPYLLAELLVEAGVESMQLMPPNFLSAVFWMNTAVLLEPYEAVVRRPAMRDAVNLHVYTEMWRLLGLGLDAPPSEETFLGRLYADRFGRDEVRAARTGT